MKTQLSRLPSSCTTSQSTRLRSCTSACTDLRRLLPARTRSTARFISSSRSSGKSINGSGWRHAIGGSRRSHAAPAIRFTPLKGATRAVAFSRPKWQLTGRCIVLMMPATMGFGNSGSSGVATWTWSARASPCARAPRTRTAKKNSFECGCAESMTWVLERSKKLGGSEPEHYILPHRPRGTRASHWRKRMPGYSTAHGQHHHRL